VSTDVQRLIDRDHADPHSYLGAHPGGAGGVVVRAYRPAAERIDVVALGATSPLEAHSSRRDLRGRHRDSALPLDYELEVDYGEAGSFTLRDPYGFLPTIGELDLHLFGEGRHETAYEKLGAHVREHGGVAGTSFAVWAPAARSVSVVGDFNSWDGRLSPMRSLGSSGIWELFVPAWKKGPGTSSRSGRPRASCA
jgi:1,4-alpha-glucan branching enzyme